HLRMLEPAIRDPPGSPRTFHLEIKRAGRRISGAFLYYMPGSAVSLPALGREAAAFIEEPGLAHAIALVMHDAADALNNEAVSGADIEEARSALETARRRNKLEENDE